ncbi:MULTISPECIES: type I polyketide synthase [Streptomyces]|uniref:type I polyketide synthase n=1 Tax=Streptomyces TaxID=1883 RepID=UPI002249452A|nr:type I polyketide synthase [Streptomyces sp. JHD 1]MCX2970489.1 beta-ketoacyl synthase N-terminal-like domain-containing protein [Streptomyces sp. JHD 1]
MSAEDAAALRRWLVTRVADLTGVDPAAVDADAPLTELGLSSVQTTTLTAELADRVGRALPETLAWERPTVSALAGHLAVEDAEGAPDAVAPEDAFGPAPGPGGPAGPPIAVVGLGCRFPGADGPEAFWELLDAGRDAVGEVPAERWAAFARGAEETRLLAGVERRAGVLEDIAGFDAEFFGVTPREAALMDPHQRVLLEVATEALEHAGVPPASLRGSRTGVFVGASATEYAQLTARTLRGVQEWTATGAAPSVLANRLSYVLDLHGPSMTVDTACSSSLVAVHLACRSLADGESDTALAAGVNLLLTPAISATFGLAGALSHDGRCKAFDAAADGIVRGEGCGVLVLKRLADARRDGSRVLAVLRGTATNSDGRSNGLMAPRPGAQRELLARACARADVDATAVDYVEAHGTGTPLGDPIEAEALGAVLGRARESGRPLLLGSVKTNLGHLEAAAGVAGLMKVVLGLAHGRIPPTLHHTRPNPRLRLDRDRLRVVTAPTPWPRYSGRAVAGVSGFGFGGTNAHVVVEEWPQHRPAAPAPDGVQVLALSDADPARVRTGAARLARWLADDAGAPPGDVAFTLARHRDHLPYRAAAVGADRAALAAALRGVAAGDRPVVRSGAAGRGVVWVFSGFGSQYPGMAARLLQADAPFADAVRALDPLFTAQAGFALSTALRDTAEAPGLFRDQLALFGVQVALAARWRAAGVEPAAVIGHSMGEVAAAVAAGALDAADGLRVMAVRARLLAGASAAGGGAMAAVELSPGELADLVGEDGGRLSDVTAAVLTAPQHLTVTGPAEQVAELVARVERAGRLAKPLRVTAAGHSPQVEPLLAELREELAALSPTVPKVPWYGTVHEDPRELPACDADYWAANLRRPVRLSAAVSAAVRDGHRAYLELSPGPLLVSAVEATAAAEGVADVLATGTLHRAEDDATAFHTALAQLHLHGHPTVLAERYRSGHLADLPRRAWRHRRHWFSEPGVPASDAGTGAGAAPEDGATPEYGATPAHGTGTGTDAAPGDGAAPADAWPGPDALTALPPARARTVLTARLRTVLAGITGHPADAFAPDTPLTTLGLDSLMAQRARNAVERDFGVRLPLTPLLRGAGLADVAGFLARELRLTPGPGEPEPGGLEPGEPEPAAPGRPRLAPVEARPAAPPVGPRDPAERLVARLWRRLLGPDAAFDVRHDAFPSVGGTPARAAALAELLAAELGHPLDAADLLARPTVAGMADAVRHHVDHAPGDPLRVLRPPEPGERADGAPLFLFHPAGGPTSVYRPLVERLPRGFPCYGLERLAELATVEAKAARYAELLGERQPPGLPYRLGGWSFGGVLAHETARRLTAAGAEVELVVLIDAVLPLRGDGGDAADAGTERLRRFVRHIEHTYGARLDVPWDELAGRSAPERIGLLTDLLAAHPGLDIGAAALRHQYTSAVDTHVAEEYRPGPYDGAVVLYRAAAPHEPTVALDPRYRRTDRALGWDEHCAGLTVVEVPGDHLSVIDPPHVDRVAGHLGAALTTGGSS